MDCPVHLVAAIRDLVLCEPGRSAHVVTMPSLFPSGTWVQLDVSEVGKAVVISDAARAMSEIRMTGMQHQRPGLFLARAARTHGISYSRGVLSTEVTDLTLLSDALARVASAAAEGVVRAVESYRFPNVRNFRFAFDSFINDQFPQQFHKEELQGKTRPHPFDYVHRGGRTIVLDPVQHNELSINKAFTVHSDLQMASQSPEKQIIVYDSDDGWARAEINLLANSGAEVMRYGQVQHDLSRLLA